MSESYEVRAARALRLISRGSKLPLQALEPVSGEAEQIRPEVRGDGRKARAFLLGHRLSDRNNFLAYLLLSTASALGEPASQFTAVTSPALREAASRPSRFSAAC